MVFCPFWPVFLFPLPGLKALTSIDVVRGAQVELKASSNSNIEQSGSTVIWNFISDSIVLVSAWWNPAFPKCFCLCVCVYTLKIRTLMCTKTHQMILNNITINKKIKKRSIIQYHIRTLVKLWSRDSHPKVEFSICLCFHSCCLSIKQLKLHRFRAARTFLCLILLQKSNFSCLLLMPHQSRVIDPPSPVPALLGVGAGSC